MFIHYDELESRGELTLSQMGKILGIARGTMLKYIESGIVNATFTDKGFYVVSKDEQERLKQVFHIGEKVYTVQDVVTLLKIRRTTLVYLCKDGDIEAYMLPTGRYLIPESSVDELKKRKRFGKKTIMWRSN